MVKIRKMDLEDVPAVHKYGVRERRFSMGERVFWSLEQLQNWIRNGSDVLLVAEESNKIVGYVTSQFHRPTGKAVLENLYVSESYRGKHLGSRLISEAIDQLKARGANYICSLVEPDNEAIAKILEGSGFTKQRKFLWMDISTN